MKIRSAIFSMFKINPAINSGEFTQEKTTETRRHREKQLKKLRDSVSPWFKQIDVAVRVGFLW